MKEVYTHSKLIPLKVTSDSLKPDLGFLSVLFFAKYYLHGQAFLIFDF